MFYLFDAPSILLQTIQPNASFVCREEVKDRLCRVDPVKQHDLLSILLDHDLRLAGYEVQLKGAFDSHKCHDAPLIVVGQVSDDVCFAKICDFNGVSLYEMQYTPIIYYADVPAYVEEIFAEARQ